MRKRFGGRGAASCLRAARAGQDVARWVGRVLLDAVLAPVVGLPLPVRQLPLAGAAHRLQRIHDLVRLDLPLPDALPQPPQLAVDVEGDRPAGVAGHTRGDVLAHQLSLVQVGEVVPLHVPWRAAAGRGRSAAQRWTLGRRGRG